MDVIPCDLTGLAGGPRVSNRKDQSSGPRFLEKLEHVPTLRVVRQECSPLYALVGSSRIRVAVLKYRLVKETLVELQKKTIFIETRLCRG